MSVIDCSPVWCGRPSYMAASHATWPQGITTVAVRQCKPTDCIQFHIIACSHNKHTAHRATAQTAFLKNWYTWLVTCIIVWQMYIHGHKRSLLNVGGCKQSRLTVRKTVYFRTQVTFSYSEDRASFSWIFISTKQNYATLSVYMIFQPWLISNLTHKILICLYIMYLLKSSTSFEHYPAHLQEVYVVIVYICSLWYRHSL